MDWAGFGIASFCLLICIIVMGGGQVVYDWIYNRGKRSNSPEIESLKSALACKKCDIANLEWTMKQDQIAFDAYKKRVEEAVNGEIVE